MMVMTTDGDNVVNNNDNNVNDDNDNVNDDNDKEKLMWTGAYINNTEDELVYRSIGLAERTYNGLRNLDMNISVTY